MHTVTALLCFVVVIHWLIFPYPSGLLHCHCGNLTIAPVPAKQPWCLWINTSCEFIINDCITTTKQSRTKPCAYLWGYTVVVSEGHNHANSSNCMYWLKTEVKNESGGEIFLWNKGLLCLVVCSAKGTKPLDYGNLLFNHGAPSRETL